GLAGIALITASISQQFIPIVVLGMFIFVSLTAFLDMPGLALRWVAIAIILYGIALAVRAFTPIWRLTVEPLYLAAYFLFPAIGLVAIGLFGQHIAIRLNQTMLNSETARAELADRNRALSQAQEELKAHYAHLEQSVQERTSELTVAQKEWENIFQAIGHPAVILDPQHRVVAANRAVAEATGLSMEELIGQMCYVLFHKNDIIPPTCPMEKMLSSGCFETNTMEMEAFNGTFLVSCTPVLDEQGHLLKTIHIATDITGQKKAEEALRRHADKLEALSHASLAIGGRLDLGGLLKSVVEQSVELFEGIWGAIYLSYHEEHGVFGMQIPLDSSLRPSRTVLKYIEELAADAWKAGKPIIVNAPPHWQTSAGAAGHDSRRPWGSFMCTLLRWGQESLGVIIVAAKEPDKFLATDVRLLSLFSGQAAIAITNAHTFETGQDTQKQLHALASYLQAAREKERTHIAREIHDEFGQAMTALKMDVSWLKRHLPADDASISEKTDDMSNLIDSTIQTVRRVATELRPGLLDDLGLVAAIEWQVNEFSERAGCHCETYRATTRLLSIGIAQQPSFASYRKH
ncbi:MAG: GAF domain-containing protein, partial [Chloroflexi bacterium]|nr:GAF domain-containing protein [Chloroflexota bacterium]